MKIGVLTGGGDCPGLNPAIRAITLRAMDYGDQLVGIRRGWAGLLDCDTCDLTLDVVEDLIRQGGTYLESSRTNPFKRDEDVRRTVANIKDLGLDALIALGGEDTLGVANKLAKMGLPTVGVPKTMDNDLRGTDYTFGFNSACQVAVEAADRLKDTARSHRRIIVLEVMGRHAGWVALEAGVGAGADWILIPEVRADLDEMCEHLQQLRSRGKHYGLVVVSEGVKLPKARGKAARLDAFGHERLQGAAAGIAQEVEARTGFETREVVLGHIIRGGPPSAFDRMLATRVGIKAVELVHEGRFGTMAALRGTRIVSVPLEAATSKLKRVPRRLYQEMKTLFNN